MALAVLSALAASGCEQPAETADAGSGYMVGEDEAILMRVNGRTVPEARLSAYAPPGIEIDEQVRVQVSQNIVVSELLTAEAIAHELHKSIEIREQMEIARQTVLSRAIISKLLEGASVSEAEVQSRYDQIAQGMQGHKEYNARHILVESEEEAKEIIAQLETDMSQFAKIAQEKSSDPGSGRNGGELGWASPETYVPEFSASIQELGEGGLTKEPVKSQFGWHIIAVDGIREQDPPPLDDQLRERIQSSIQNEVITAYIDDLRSKAEIEQGSAN
jgi:peptidyl-prolyl cis-trans isomerase C